MSAPSPFHIYFFLEGVPTTEKANAVLQIKDYEAPPIGERVRIRRFVDSNRGNWDREDYVLTVLHREWQYDTTQGGIQRCIIVTCRREPAPSEQDAYDVIGSGGVG